VYQFELHMTHPNRRHGQALRSIGTTLFWIGLVGASAALGFRSEMDGSALMAIVLGLTIAAFIGIALMHRGRKLVATSGDERLAADLRKPVVYLRSFAADSVGAGAVSSWPLLKFGYFTDEEQLAVVMNELGPFIAIGDPREALPDLGADRVYVGEGNWQQRIQDLLRDACLVVLRAATSENFWWEFQTVRAHVAPERVLLLVNTAGPAYEAFRTRAADVLPYPLPELAPRKRGLGHLQAIIAFDKSWHGQELPIVRSFRRTHFTAPFVGPLKLTLKPIYERLGVPWVPPPVATKKLIVLWTCGIFGALAFALALAIALPDYLNPQPDYTPVQLAPTSTPEPVPSDAVTGGPPAARSTYDTQLAILRARLSSRPEFQERVNGLSAEQAREVGRQLAMRGLPRLTDDELVVRARVLDRILSLSDTTTCSAIVNGTSAPGLEAAIRRLSDDEVQEWLELVFESTVAEIEQRMIPTPPPRTRITHALGVISSRLSREDADLLKHVLTEPHTASDEDACKAGKLLYGTLPALSAEEQAVLARAFVIH
jgi:hypothetical protein